MIERRRVKEEVTNPTKIVREDPQKTKKEIKES